MRRGYWGVALYQPKNEYNWGTVLRSCYNFGADFVITIGHRYKKQCSYTVAADRHIPVFHYPDIENFLNALPVNCIVVPVETNGSTNLFSFCHPERAVYVFGGEDLTLPESIMKFPRSAFIQTNRCLNLSVAASIVMYDRLLKRQ